MTASERVKKRLRGKDVDSLLNFDIFITGSKQGFET